MNSKIRIELSDLNILKVIKLERGLSNDAFLITLHSNNEKIDSKLIFKEYKLEKTKEDLDRLVLAQNYFSEKTSKIPRIIKCGLTSDFPKGYMLMNYCKGETIADNSDLVTKFAINDLISILNIFGNAKFNEVAFSTQKITIGDFYKGVLDMIQETTVHLQYAQSKFLNHSYKILNNVSSNKILYSSELVDKFVHYDLSFENILLDSKGLSGIIDFDLCRQGDSNFDKHYLLCHLLQAGVHIDNVKYAVANVFKEGISDSTYDSGIFISNFVALQQVMTLRKRIIKNPVVKTELIKSVSNFLDEFMQKNKYEALLNEIR